MHLPLLTSILLLLVVSRIMGELITKIKQPAIVGEILAGILLGPAILGFIAPNHELAGITELAVFLVVLSAGLEMDFRDVMGALRWKTLTIAVIGFVIPLVSGILLGTFFFLGLSQSVFLGLCFAITALPVAIRILENLNILDTKVGHYALGSAVLVDVVALLVLGIILDAPEQASAKKLAISVGTTSLKMFAFFGGIFLINKALRWKRATKYNVQRFVEKIVRKLGHEALFGVALVFVLIFSSVSESLGFHFVIGAFFGGLLLNKDIVGPFFFPALQHTLNSISGGFLAPIFFAYLGLQFSTNSFEAPFFVAAVIIVSLASKIWGVSIASRLVGIPKKEGLGIGIILNSRGVMDLVVANIALERGFIDEKVFSTLVLLGILSTVLTPILFSKFAKIESDVESKEPAPTS